MRQAGAKGWWSREETAAYVADMAGALARIARGHGLDVLGYLLDMARLEARGIAGHFGQALSNDYAEAEKDSRSVSS